MSCTCRWQIGDRLQDKLNALEDDAIDRALSMFKTQAAASRELGMSARTLRYILSERAGHVFYKRKRKYADARSK